MDLTTLALVTQWIGTLLTLTLLAFLAQSFRRPLARYWTVAWLALAISLGALAVAFQDPRLGIPFKIVYFFGEYTFAFFLIAGCRHFASSARITRRSFFWLAGGLVVAVVLSLVSRDFNLQFSIHAGIMAVAFATAFRALAPARRARLGGGVTVISYALFLLAVDFFHYVPVFAIAARLGPSHRFDYLNYTSVADMALEILLGFGMVMLILDTLRREAESANAELAKALAREALAARTDPLTSALNRHAYHALANELPAGGGVMHGCAVIADLDKLKEINDTDGHAAGDRAIRTVATAIRSVIRADDLLIRWGGDEFLAILWNIGRSEAAKRFDHFDDVIGRLQPAASPAALTVSFGVAEFGSEVTLDQAIEVADSLMYAQKAQRRGEIAVK
jgi:diguanylate cyclase (GGDEF)-like protein